MRKFLLGFVAGVAVIALAAFYYVRFGFLDSRADIPVNALEQKIAMPSLDASVDRRAPDIKNPVEASDANLIAGMKIYQANCAACHGDVNHTHAMLADSLYPRAPQFAEDSPDMPENQNLYIIQHGVRLSGMPAWKQSLSDQQMWQVTTFLSHMDRLPPQVSEQWKANADGSTAPTSSPRSSSMDKNMRMK
jgi:mono/diheme cytochrome c family protein